MEGVGFLTENYWHLFGLKHWFFNINSGIVIDTWVALLIILAILIPCNIILRRKPGMAHFAVISTVNYFVNMTKQAFGYFEFKHFAFTASVFIFIITCNLLALVPWLEEPTKNANTTLAIGIISFFYTQYYTVKAHGAWAYTKEYFEPIFVMFPLHVISKIASIVSISFRLFGNIFGGFIISEIYFKQVIEGSWWKESLGLLTGINFVIKGFFGVFEGFLQAFVFTMLTITYLSMAVQTDDTHKEGKPAC